LIIKIKNKCRSKRNDLAANIRNTMFSNFGEQKLERVDSSASSKKIAEWKKSAKTREAYRELFENQGIFTKITSSVFKSYEGSELPPEHWVYVLAICDIVLNPSSPGIKCNDKLVLKRVDFLMVIITFISTLKLKILKYFANINV